MVRAAGTGYEVVDLNSSNGTWVNGQRLVPNKPYDLPNGAVLQLGRLKLIASYLQVPVAGPA
jgi:pSer/pThr/pTyr-binding forkhead associated (FHA) protein